MSDDPYRNPAVERRSKRRVHVIQIGDRPGIVELGAQRAFGGRSSIRVPRFPDRCVCCNADAGPHRLDYDASDADVQTAPIEVPVCPPCQRHGFVSAGAAQMWGLGVMLGLLMGGGGYSYWSERGDTFTLGFMLVGLTLFAVSAARVLALLRKERAINRGDHYGNFFISVSQGVTVVRTSSEKLAADLLALNDDAVRLR